MIIGKKQEILTSRCFLFFAAFFSFSSLTSAHAQDGVRTGTNHGATKIRLATADFKTTSNDSQTGSLKTAFDTTLMNDLSNAGIFDMVSKSMAPPLMPGSPQEIQLAQWAAAPSNADMVAFGAIGVSDGKVTVYGYLFDAKNQQSPQILGKQYSDNATVDNARMIAHRFADEIITRLGGIAGICETKIYFVSNRTGNKEIWAMDYDGQNARQLAHLGTVSLSPHVSPDNSRVAFSSLGKNGWSIRMYSLDLGRLVAFPEWGDTTLSPAWSSDGTRLAFSSARTGDPDIYVCDASGANAHRITAFRGP